ncbi:outer membrane beta-barrel protein [Flammeovirga yaeyamensis]|uniref:Outer membrane beta-barrel protein n=1 Tax=Flammeovirga yaeyamensis TaxID=367791 RepID=A0AAX1MZA8_9BACT|nr:TonB-dependent receptor [Flammeovirga yaeyamensis]MBB3695914.1 outer membrane receptor protein involved in Fe transport [Flammeovirga yaeyamensis]NMF34603.1 outer membrane beta-barrel protein [Flammeovirga yaeyamensis]QWG00567.1 outer membrane beta-barrel protein [Flammeovirga yaeyamensis]
MYKTLLLSIIFYLTYNSSLLGQTIKGTITDESGEALIGASVVIEGTTNGAMVGLNGMYLIKGGQQGSQITLVASFIGFESQRKSIQLNGNTEVNFVLKTDQQELDEVVIMAQRELDSDASARATEQHSAMVLNVVSANTIELSPDLNVADVVQRISGVSLEQSNAGVGSYAIVRGMPKRYSYTLVNGVKIPSPDNKNRYVPLDMFPSELLDRIEVTKALTPSMEGDAVGGVMDLIMKNAKDNFSFKINASGGMSSLFMEGSGQDFLTYNQSLTNRVAPHHRAVEGYEATFKDFTTNNLVPSKKTNPIDFNIGTSISNRFFDGKLGVVVAGNYQKLHRGSDTHFYSIGFADIVNNVMSLNTYQHRQYSSEMSRGGVHNKIDYIFNNKHSISMYNALIFEREDQVRETERFRLWDGEYNPETNSGTASLITRIRTTEQKIYNSTLQGNHQLLPNWKLNWSGVYSIATRNRPDQMVFTRNASYVNGVPKQVRVEDFGGQYRQWEDNEDRDYTAYINNIFDLNRFGELKVGGMYRDKARTNSYIRYNFKPLNDETKVDEDWYYNQVDWVLTNPRGGQTNPLNYDAHERILAYYGEYKIAPSKKTEIVGGVRAEHTDQGYELRYPRYGEEPSASQEYVDFLPSLHFRYMLNEKSNLRASYFRSVIRPGFFEIIPYEIGAEISDSEFAERGNPDLKRTITDNFDLRYEMFPGTRDNLFIGAFYKNIMDPIENGIVVDEKGNTFVQPGNYGTAVNYGLEVDATKYFRSFGIKANYTYTHSSITTTKILYTRENPEDNSSNIVPLQVDQERPLQGQARHIGNVSLLYKNQKNGLDIQLANVFTGKRIEQLMVYYEKDYWQKAMWQMDFSMEKHFDFGLTVFVKARNLLDTHRILYIEEPSTENQSKYPAQGAPGDNLVVRDDRYGRNFQIGLKYKL